MGIVENFSVRESASVANQSSRDLDPASSKLLGLELLRFGSALAVLLYHYNHFPKIPGALPIARGDLPFHAWLWPLYDYGQFGVELFWGISGYIFFWKYGHAIHAGAVSAKRFFWLRFSRLYPLHLATLILVAFLQVVHRLMTGEDFVFPANDLGQFVGQLFLANGWGAQPSHSFNGPIWSVSAEVAIYAGFFLLLRKFAPTLKLCCTVLLLGLVLQLNGTSSLPALCAFFFFAGGMAALLPPLTARQRVFAAAVATLIVGVTTHSGTLRNLDMVPWVILGALPFLLAALAGEVPGIDRWQRLVEGAGNLTYSTYLLHFPMQLAFAVAVAWSGILPDATQPAFLLARFRTPCARLDPTAHARASRQWPSTTSCRSRDGEDSSRACCLFQRPCQRLNIKAKY